MFKFDEDLKKVDEGVWMDFEGSKFLIAHISNMKFQRALSRLQQPHRRKIEQGSIDPNLNKRIVAEAMAEGVLLDWKNVGSVGGETPAYTPKLGMTALMKSVEFRDWVSEIATNMSNYRDEEISELGND